MTITQTVDVSGIVKFANQMRKVSPVTAEKTRTVIVEAGELVKKEADKRARAIMPNKAPKIDVRVGDVGAVVVAQIRATGNLGKLFEAGGKGGKAGSPAAWRHPLFGNTDYWYDQKPQPYLVPALHSTRDEVLARMLTKMNLVMAEYFDRVFEGG